MPLLRPSRGARVSKVVGVTGGLGSGKTTAARILGELGAHVIDADLVGHDIYRPGSEGFRRVVGSFGPEVIAGDGTIDRKRLGSIVFSDPVQLKRLNAAVHPLMGQEMRRRIDALRAAGWRAPIVIDAAVLIEGNWVSLVDEVWLIVASRKAILSRVAAQRGLDRAAIEARIRSQLSDEERRPYATVVVDNSGSLGDLRAQLERLWHERLAPVTSTQ